MTSRLVDALMGSAKTSAPCRILAAEGSARCSCSTVFGSPGRSETGIPSCQAVCYCLFNLILLGMLGFSLFLVIFCTGTTCCFELSKCRAFEVSPVTQRPKANRQTRWLLRQVIYDLIGAAAQSRIPSRMKRNVLVHCSTFAFFADLLKKSDK